MCGAHATVRGFLGELIARSPTAFDIIVDMEAGLEHLSRGTGKHVSRFLAVVEPYYRSMETARRITELAGELGIADVEVVINKTRNQADREAVTAFCVRHDLRVMGDVPFDPALADAERDGHSPVDYAPHTPSIEALRQIAHKLVSTV
jgi:CO dehydrogenase maturation factor